VCGVVLAQKKKNPRRHILLVAYTGTKELIDIAFIL
jgi:hypothetical protein